MALDSLPKRLLLFSGGLDSYILKKVYDFKDEECLFVDMGTVENGVEKEKIFSIFPNVRQVSCPLAAYELENKIIPFRNHFLTLLAAQFVSDIYFAFTIGDTTRDKDFVFKAQMESILNYFSGVLDKVNVPGPYTLHMPFKGLSKGEIVRLYLERTHTDGKELVDQSVSCYSGAVYGCGQCRSCLRKYVALAVNSSELGEYCRSKFDSDPVQFLPEFLGESLRKKRNTKEIKEIERCIMQA